MLKISRMQKNKNIWWNRRCKLPFLVIKKTLTHYINLSKKRAHGAHTDSTSLTELRCYSF